MRPRARALPAAAVALALAPAAAMAETVVQDVTVTASIETACVASSAVLDFGTYDPRDGSDRTASTSIRLDCPDGVQVIVRLDGGLNPDGGERRMAGERGDFLRYNLFTQSDGGRVWGDGVTFGQALIRFVSSIDPLPPVVGRIPRGQLVRPGVYSDTVAITVEVDAGSNP